MRRRSMQWTALVGGTVGLVNGILLEIHVVPRIWNRSAQGLFLLLRVVPWAGTLMVMGVPVLVGLMLGIVSGPAPGRRARDRIVEGVFGFVSCLFLELCVMNVF